MTFKKIENVIKAFEPSPEQIEREWKGRSAEKNQKENFQAELNDAHMKALRNPANRVFGRRKAI